MIGKEWLDASHSWWESGTLHEATIPGSFQTIQKWMVDRPLWAWNQLPAMRFARIGVSSNIPKNAPANSSPPQKHMVWMRGNFYQRPHGSLNIIKHAELIIVDEYDEYK